MNELLKKVSNEDIVRAYSAYAMSLDDIEDLAETLEGIDKLFVRGVEN